MTYAEVLAEDRRLAILKLLAESGGSGNESVLRTGLEMLGHTAELTRDNVRKDILFLNECGLVVMEWFSDKIVVCKITKRGVDVANGRERVEGVKKPSVGV